MQIPTQRPIVAILEGDWVVSQALEILLRGVDYDTKILKKAQRSPGVMDGLLGGVDLLLIAPGLGDGSHEAFLNDGSHEAFLKSMRSTSARLTIPVLTLSTTPLVEAQSDGSVVVLWPTSIENLTREIEAVLASARSSNEQGALSICGCGRRCCC